MESIPHYQQFVLLMINVWIIIIVHVIQDGDDLVVLCQFVMELILPTQMFVLVKNLVSQMIIVHAIMNGQDQLVVFQNVLD